MTLLSRVPEMHTPAFLPSHFSRYPVIGQVYPGVISRGNTEIDQDLINYEGRPLHELNDEGVMKASVSGILLSGLNTNELKVLDWFEDVDYTRTKIPVYVHVENSLEKVEADVYVWSAGDHLLDLDSTWDYDNFCTEKLDDYLKCIVAPCRMEIDRLGLQT
jgi:hypothetical protein